MSNSDRYTKIVYWSEEDQCFVGGCPRLVLGGCHGSDPKTVFAELCEIVGEAAELYAYAFRVRSWIKELEASK